MDLDNFEETPPGLPSTELCSGDGPEDILKLFDEKWYTPASRRARWMDLIGDYGGKEAFVIEGDSLIQNVLDNHRLALGKSNDNSFQILHAKFLLEKAIVEFTSRDANFEVVFFQQNRSLSVGVQSEPFITRSRALARKILFNHIVALDGISVRLFDAPHGHAWKEYVSKNQPMFILANDGGNQTPKGGDIEASRILAQRSFFFDLTKQGFALALLYGAEYRDSKIMTFVFESSASVRELVLPSTNHVKSDLEAAWPCENLISSPDQGVPSPGLLRASLQEEGPSILKELFILHCALLPYLSPEYRARTMASLSPELEALLHDDFLPAVFHALAKLQTPPDVDGRIFSELLRFLLSQSDPNAAFEELIPSSLKGDFGATIDLVLLQQTYPLPTSSKTSPTKDPEPYTLLPFSNRVFDNALRKTHLESYTLNSEEVPQVVTESIFGLEILMDDTKHWHNNKSILPSHLGGKPVSEAKLTDWEIMKRKKKEQRDQARLQKQAASLTGASGKVLVKVVIPPAGSGRVGKRAVGVKEKQQHKGGSAKKLKPLTKSELIIAQNSSLKLKEAERKSTQWWKDVLQSWKDKTTEDQLILLEPLKKASNPKMSFPPMALEIRLYQIHLILHRWSRLNPEEEAVRARDTTVVNILRILGEIRELNTPLSPDVAKFLGGVCSILGFGSYTSSLLPPLGSTTVIPMLPALSFTLPKVVNKHGVSTFPGFMKILQEPVEWQLEHYGEWMDRSMESEPDVRVSFSPDRWQRSVLDAIDKDESILVLAPTSAGKTFISFYAMERVLRQSDNGILVYVAPTKALVNQIAAEVYGRFSKSYTGNNTLLAVFTRDTRSGDLHRAQILVTVPEMLGILLLSPSLAGNWTSRIERIILDEIHSIGQEQGGAIWEQILLLAPCPIIGLSATVGSPDGFNTWLESIQTSNQRNHTYIHHPHRYSHLRKFFFTPSSTSFSEKITFNGLGNYVVSKRITHLHPISLLSDHASSLPTDLALESRDCATLFNALKDHSIISEAEIKQLDPTTFFKSRSTSFLRQKDVLEYEAKLKEAVVGVIKNDPEAMHKITEALQDPILKVAEVVDVPPTPKEFERDLMTLVADLHVQNSLPAILFNFNRTNCEIMAQSLTQLLQESEDRWKKNSPQWKARLAQVESWRKMKKTRDAQQERQSRQKKDHDAPRDDSSSLSWQASFDENEPQPDFSFAGKPSSQEELNSLIHELEKWSGEKIWVIDALRRGIAVHHAGMSKRYRVAIENLFREGYIRVMISTGTLALGINAPARTSVFCGDSPYLTALTYRQCAGRAGRRGFDLLGNVVFYGVPYSRVQRLILSRLPKLGDSFPMTSTLILRLFNLLNGSQYADFAVNSIKSVLSLPRISYRSNMGREQVLHHVRFSIEYLRHCGLLNHLGQPTNLFGMASHLYYTEPSNFALVNLFESGLIHEICSQSSVRAEQEMLLLFCHLFGRKRIPSNYSQPVLIARLQAKYPSQIILPKLPQRISKRLQEHNHDIIKMFTAYALSYSKENRASLGVDLSLPLSGDQSPRHKSVESSRFLEHLQATSLSPVARSIFAASSGLDDHFESISDLVSAVRCGIHLHEYAIPSMHHFVEHSNLLNMTESEHALNAYILDFYSHGQLSTLANANGIRQGDVWYLLQDFEMILKAVQSSIEELLVQLSLARTAAKSAAEEESMGIVAEQEEDDEKSDDEDSSCGIARPPNTRDEDWKVYEIVTLITTRFGKKFRKIWA